MQYKDLQEIYDFGRKLGLPEIPERHHAKMFKEWDESGASKEEIKKQLKEQSETDQGKEIISEAVKSKKMLLGLIDIIDKVVSGKIVLEDIQTLGPDGKQVSLFKDREPKQPTEFKCDQCEKSFTEDQMTTTGGEEIYCQKCWPEKVEEEKFIPPQSTKDLDILLN